MGAVYGSPQALLSRSVGPAPAFSWLGRECGTGAGCQGSAPPCGAFLLLIRSCLLLSCSVPLRLLLHVYVDARVIATGISRNLHVSAVIADIPHSVQTRRFVCASFASCVFAALDVCLRTWGCLLLPGDLTARTLAIMYACFLLLVWDQLDNQLTEPPLTFRMFALQLRVRQLIVQLRVCPVVPGSGGLIGDPDCIAIGKVVRPLHLTVLALGPNFCIRMQCRAPIT